jgi:hypothetical protein
MANTAKESWPRAVARDGASLERDVNAELSRAHVAIMSDPERVATYQGMFDRTVETGFYGEDSPIRGHGEKPTWKPNPAYITSLVAMWEGDDDGSGKAELERRGLTLERPLEELFYDSHEYEDTELSHRRVFQGHLVDIASRRPVTFFMLTVPHSHERFDLVQPPVIAVSSLLV